VLGIGQPDGSCPLGLLCLAYQERALSALAGHGANSQGKAVAPEDLVGDLADPLGLPGVMALMADDDVGCFDIPARRSGMLREMSTPATRWKSRACGPSTPLLGWMVGTLPAWPVGWPYMSKRSVQPIACSMTMVRMSPTPEEHLPELARGGAVQFVP